MGTWWKAAVQGDGRSAPGVLQAWAHALAAKRQDVADQAADLLSSWLDGRGTYAHSAVLGARHVAAFPDSVIGLNWTGYRPLHPRKVFGTRDHYMYADTEFTLAMLVFQLGCVDEARERGCVDEARKLGEHAVAVLQAQVPSHSILVMLRAAATPKTPTE